MKTKNEKGTVFRVSFKLQISHRSKCSFILINFATDFFFKQRESPSDSQVVSRKRWKSSTSIICLFWWISKLSRRRSKLIYSVSVFTLYILTKIVNCDVKY